MKELELLLKNIKNKAFLPIYFFHGEEPYFIDVATSALENGVLSEEEKAFGQTVVYGKETNVPEIISLAGQFPMMGDYNVIIVKEAQDLRFDDKALAALAAYVASPAPTTILVFAHKHKKMDERKKFMKTLKSGGMLFLSEPLREYEIAKWITAQCAQLKIKVEPGIPDLLADHLGTDLSRIMGELSKMKLILKEGEVLNGDLVETHIGVSKEFNVFELKKALNFKEADKALRIAYYMGKSSSNLGNTIVILYRNFSDIIFYHTMQGAPEAEMVKVMSITRPFFLQEVRAAARNYSLKHATRVLSILREIHMKERGIGATGEASSGPELLKELTYKILNVDKFKVAL